MILATLLGATLALAPADVTTASLLAELADARAIARLPDPPYRLLQASSYDRRSKEPKLEEGWFANDDWGKFVRTEQREGRTESVMMDAAGPGAVVRIWSPNPKGTMRIYLDGAERPVLEASMSALLDGRALWGDSAHAAPLAGERSRGWNLFLPIPFATRCVITTDDGEGVYYQVDWRAYPEGTPVRSFERAQVPAAPAATGALATLAAPASVPGGQMTVASAGRAPLLARTGAGGCIESIEIEVEAGPNWKSALGKLVLDGVFDGERTVQVPLTALCSWAPGAQVADARRAVACSDAGVLRAVIAWPMPFAEGANLGLVNLGTEPVRVRAVVHTGEWTWDGRSMHFHADWHRLRALRTRPMRDVSFLDATGEGVYAGDSLQVLNPVDAWWGEGDEKIRVDGEAFPSSFGTGTEDYYGYGWCDQRPFRHPLHSQTLCDGDGTGTNWGRTIVTRLRGLDGVPFQSRLQMDMELWHWGDCTISYAPTTMWYARPGARRATGFDAGECMRGDPTLPEPMRLAGAVECERMQVGATSPGLQHGVQSLREFAAGSFSGDRQLWVRATAVGDWIELLVPAPAGPCSVRLFATKSWDYGVVRFAVDGVEAGKPVDLCSGMQGRVLPVGPIDLGVHTATDGVLRVRATLVGRSAAAQAPGTFFGLDAVVVAPVAAGAAPAR
ncbi:MAG: glycoside hydrolase family 172 protein [Phycisphaerales bacterium]